MSLVKVAINPFELIMPGVGTTAAMSGSPINWLMKKVPKKKIFGFIPKPSLRRKVQEINISTMANAINDIRNGRIQDSTRLGSAIFDATTGHAGKLGVGVIESLNNAEQSIVRKPYRELINKIVRTDGGIDIDHLESSLKKMHGINGKASLYHNKPIVLSGGMIGAGIGALKSPSDKHSRLGNASKGFMVGGSLGYTAKRSLGSIVKLTNPMSQFHDIYFTDNYWKDRIIGANKSLIGPTLSRSLTAYPERRFARLDRFNALSEWNKDIFNKQKTKNAWNATIKSFKHSKEEDNEKSLWSNLSNRILDPNRKFKEK